jgi:hypothetical protein
LQSGSGKILAQIAAATAGATGFAFVVTPNIAWAVVNGAKNAWNTIAAKIQAIVKFTPVIQGIPIAPI